MICGVTGEVGAYSAEHLQARSYTVFGTSLSPPVVGGRSPVSTEHRRHDGTAVDGPERLPQRVGDAPRGAALRDRQFARGTRGRPVGLPNGSFAGGPC